ncbi:hypothetical protein NONI108955_41225 [Nocardia ninae]
MGSRIHESSCLNMKKIVAAGLLASGVLLLSACDPSRAGTVGTEVRTVRLPDGRTVVCVVAANTSAKSAAVDCDWQHSGR